MIGIRIFQLLFPEIFARLMRNSLAICGGADTKEWLPSKNGKFGAFGRRDSKAYSFCPLVQGCLVQRMHTSFCCHFVVGL